MRRLLWLTVLVPLLVPARAAAVDQLCDTRKEDCRAPLLARINAEPSGGAIDVAFWFMEDGRYSAALINAKNRGVTVRVLVDPRANKTKRENETILNQMKTGGLQMRMKLANSWGDILHWKIMYFERQGVVEFSAANYSPYSFVPVEPFKDYIDEVVYFTDDPRLTNSFRTKFDDFWVDTEEFANYANITGPLTRSYPVSPIDPALNFTPFQNYASRAVSHYNREPSGAQGGKIDVIMYRFSDARHGDAMLAAKSRGIPIRMITEPENYRDSRYIWHSYNVDRLWAAGIPVKQRIKQGITHQKSVILYGQREVIFGSSNWSSASATEQYEHNLFSRPCDVVTGGTWCDSGFFFQFFVDQFEEKWNASAEFAAFTPRPGGTPVNQAPANGAINIGTTTVTLKWDGGNWNHKYDVYFGTDPNNLTRIATDVIVGSPYTGRPETWDVSSLSPGTTYYWRVVGKTMAAGPRADAAGLHLEKSGAIWSFTTAGTGGGGGSTPFGGTPVTLPGTIQAENFDNGGAGVAYVDMTAGNSGGQYRSTDVDIATTADTGGGYNIGYTRPGEWLRYSVNVATSGTYTLTVRYASAQAGGRFHVEVDGVDKTGPMTLQNTGGWQEWQNLVKTGISLSAGPHVVRLVFDQAATSGGPVGNYNYLSFSSGSAAQSTPYGGAPWPVPGKIQAENFDSGGQNVAYHDTTSGNSGGAYRTGDVDIAATTDTGGGYNLGYTRAGEWLKYTIDVAASGTYTFNLRFANVGTGARVRLEVDGQNVTGSLSLSNTGGWQIWDNVVKTGISLSAGTHVARLVFEAGNSGSGAAGNINHFTFTSASSTQSTPYGGTPASLPGIVQAERFDEGGPIAAYFDTSQGNSGGKFRSTDVDIAATTDVGGGYNVGYTRPGEYLKYTVKATQTGTYALSFRFANEGDGGTFHLNVDGQNRTGPITLRDTGGWQSWENLDAPSISLSAGTHVLSLVFDQATPGGEAVGNFNYFTLALP